jgi:hypothetical protein
VDCHLCVYPGRGGCLDQSDGGVDALVESARVVAQRNSNGLGTIIRIKGIGFSSRANRSRLYVEWRHNLG